MAAEPDPPNREAATDVRDGPLITHAAPALLVPDVLTPDQCKALMRAWEKDNTESGMHREVDGRVVLVPDPSAKVRRDHTVDKGPLAEVVMKALGDRLLPAIYKSFFYKCTRLERLKVVCYDAETGGYFRPHRDNTTPDAAHRRFAMTLNLNTDDYEGGELRFPEFGNARYSPPAGAAVVFSCSHLHEVLDVMRGRRFVLLTFLYGEDAVRPRSAEPVVRKTHARR